MHDCNNIQSIYFIKKNDGLYEQLFLKQCIAITYINYTSYMPLLCFYLAPS